MGAEMEQSSGSQQFLRLTKICLVLAVAGWGVSGALGNLLDWAGTVGSVEAVSTMARFEGGSSDWRATQNPLIVYGGAIFIVAFKTACGLLCAVGAVQMWRSRRDDGGSFSASKQMAIAGCLIAVFGLFFGWIVVGEGWFEFWRDPGFGGLEGAGLAAFRYGGFIGLIALLVAQDE